MKPFTSNGKYVLEEVNIEDFLKGCETKLGEKRNINTDTSSTTTEPVETKSDRRKVLKLDFSEAFFLSYALGCLNVSENEHHLSIEQMWESYTKLYQMKDLLFFPVSYAAYHYFRSRGWVVKNGFTFGTNFLLYKEGPPFYHSQYSVLVIHENLETQIPKLSWKHLAALIRVTTNSKKVMTLLLLYEKANMLNGILNS